MDDKYFTLVGSRDCPQDKFEVLKFLSFVLLDFGWVGRSGGAFGADSALEAAYHICKRSSKRMEVFLPWNSFNKKFHDGHTYINAEKIPSWNLAFQVAKTIHVAWGKCSIPAKHLHTRNIYQVLGVDLNTPSQVLICYAPPTRDGVKGGTNTAYQLAIRNEIPCINVWDMNIEKAFDKLVSLGEERWGGNFYNYLFDIIFCVCIYILL